MVGLEAGGTNAAREIAAQAGALLNVEAFNGMTAFRIAMKKANSTAMEFLLKTKRHAIFVLSITVCLPVSM